MMISALLLMVSCGKQPTAAQPSTGRPLIETDARTAATGRTATGTIKQYRIEVVDRSEGEIVLLDICLYDTASHGAILVDSSLYYADSNSIQTWRNSVIYVKNRTLAEDKSCLVRFDADSRRHDTLLLAADGWALNACKVLSDSTIFIVSTCDATGGIQFAVVSLATKKTLWRTRVVEEQLGLEYTRFKIRKSRHDGDIAVSSMQKSYLLHASHGSHRLM